MAQRRHSVANCGNTAPFLQGEMFAYRGFWTPNSFPALPFGIQILSLKEILMVPLLVLKSERLGRRFHDLT